MAVLLPQEVSQTRKRGEGTGHDLAPIWLVFAWAGLAISILGWTDLALLWYPLRLGTAAWEFGTITSHLNAMPLATMGISLLAIGALGRGWGAVTRLLAVACGLVVIGLLGMLVIYLMDIPAALSGTAAQMHPLLKKGFLKAAVFFATYLGYFGFMSLFLWRRRR